MRSTAPPIDPAATRQGFGAYEEGGGAGIQAGRVDASGYDYQRVVQGADIPVEADCGR
jgi:hypothetical protein